MDEKVDALFQERSESINKLINQKQAEVLAFGALQSAIDGLKFLTDGKAKQNIHGLNDVLQLLENTLKEGTLEKVG